MQKFSIMNNLQYTVSQATKYKIGTQLYTE